MESVAKVCGISVPEMAILAGSNPILDLPLTQLAFDSLYLLELEVELEEHEGLSIDPSNVLLTPSTTLRDLYLAISTG